MSAPPDLQSEIASRFEAKGKFSPAEAKFMRNKAAQPSKRLALGWRVEALQVLLWSVGLVKRLPTLSQQGNPRALLDIMRMADSTKRLRRLAKKRSTRSLTNFSDLMYRVHWASREAQLAGKAPPNGMDPGIVAERDYASRWLVNLEVEWDDVSCDT